MSLGKIAPEKKIFFVSQQHRVLFLTKLVTSFGCVEGIFGRYFLNLRR
jgi:hypothetical protein